MKHHLPQILAEIAEVAGLDAAREVARARGGSRVSIPTPGRLQDYHWLVRAVGMENARKIARHFSTNKGAELHIPLGPFGSYLAQQREREAAMLQALDNGAKIDDTARAAGVDRSSVVRFKQRRRREAAMRQALDNGATVDDAARAAGVDRSSVIRFKQRMRRKNNRDQGSLF